MDPPKRCLSGEARGSGDRFPRVRATVMYLVPVWCDQSQLSSGPILRLSHVYGSASCSETRAIVAGLFFSLFHGAGRVLFFASRCCPRLNIADFRSTGGAQKGFDVLHHLDSHRQRCTAVFTVEYLLTWVSGRAVSCPASLTIQYGARYGGYKQVLTLWSAASARLRTRAIKGLAYRRDNDDVAPPSHGGLATTGHWP